MSEKAPDSDDDKQCAICLDVIKEPAVTLPCNHKYCSGCLESWRSKFNATASNKSCPQCRKKIPPTRQMYAQYKNCKQVLAILLEKTQRSYYELPPIPGEPNYDPHMFSNIPLELKIQLRSFPAEDQQACSELSIRNNMTNFWKISKSWKLSTARAGMTLYKMRPN